MDQLHIVRKLTESFGKYKYVLLVVALGVFLMAMPAEKNHDPEPFSASNPASDETIDRKLETILSQIRGVGKVQVLITESASSETVYQTDLQQDISGDSNSRKEHTVVISSGSGEVGLVRTVTPAVYLGAVIVCQGGDDPSVRLAVSQAVSAVTGISTDRITVLKMK